MKSDFIIYPQFSHFFAGFGDTVSEDQVLGTISDELLFAQVDCVTHEKCNRKWFFSLDDSTMRATYPHPDKLQGACR
jgi:hypothetical protein